MKKVFILDLKDNNGELIYDTITNWIVEHGLAKELSATWHHETCHLHLPESFDLYIVHVSDTSLEAMEEIKRLQPWCKVVGITGGVSLSNRPAFVDGWYWDVTEPILINILEKIDIHIKINYDHLLRDL
ncbi:MAG: hypothetical protein M1338_05265 [Patescibacteria group bacterium]|nr:hypothetical protein [Patescibacteria group bacterium]